MKSGGSNWAWKPDKNARIQIRRGDKKCNAPRDPRKTSYIVRTTERKTNEEEI